MGIYQQLKGLLKSEFIQMKRNKFLSLVEIFCPIALLLIFLLIRLLFKIEKEKYETTYNNDLEYIFNYSTNITNKIAYKTDEINENTPLPYNYFLAQCNLTKHIALIGKDFPQKIIDRISLHFWELENFNENEIFKRFETIEEFQKYTTSKDYGTDEILYPKICFGISQTDKFKFGIHYNTINNDNRNTNEIENLIARETPHIPDTKLNKNDKIRTQENLIFFEYYKTSGFLMTLKVIYDYILQEITNDPTAEINFSVIGMKYDEIIKDTFHKFLDLLGFFIIISYSIPLSINIYKEIHFRETKKKEYLRSMGVKDIIFFLASFIRCFLINLIHSLLCSLFAKLVLKHSQYIYLFLIFFLFGLDIFSLAYFFQSFLQESRIGVIISLLIYCIMSFFNLPLNSPEVNKGITYFICILFPPTNLLLGFYNFYIFEKEFFSLNNRINLDISQITIKMMIISFFISFIIYLFLGYIMRKLFCFDNNSCCYYSNKSEQYIRTDSKSTLKENRIANPPKDIQSEISDDIGNIYIDDDSEISESGKKEEKKLENKNNENDNNKELQKEIKAMQYDYIDSASKKKSKDILEKKKENLKKSLRKIQNNNIDENEKSNSDMANDDEMENDLDNQIEIQEIRNKRRLRESTMFFLKPEEKYVNENLKLSKINNIVKDKVLSKSILGLFPGNNLNNKEAKFKKNEIRKKIEKLQIGGRLEIKNITKKYDNESKFVLNNLSFNLYENEIFALLGQNGAGKSTFISILSGLIQANSGSIIYKKEKEDNNPIEAFTPKGYLEFRKILGICYQNNNILYDNLTVKENLETFCLLKYDKKKYGSKENNHIKKEVEDLIRDFELQKVRNSLAKNLSGGYKRRLCIAIAFCGRSKVIVLDEPTGGIDITDTKKLWKILKKIKNEKNKIILLITHFMEEVSFLADKIGILKNGQLLYEGTNRQLIDDHGNYITIQINKKLNQYTIEKLRKYIEDNIILKDNSISNELINDTQSNKLIDPSNSSIISINIDKMELIEYKEKIVIKIQVNCFDYSKTSELLNTFEKEYNIYDYRIIKDQLEDVFINTIDKYSKKEDDKKEDDFKDLFEVDNHINKNITNFEKFKNELKILIFKRFYETIRDKKSFILEIIFPIILTLFACLVSYIEILEDNRAIPIELNNFSNDTQTIYYEFNNKNDITEYQKILIPDEENEKIKLQNYQFIHLSNSLGREDYNIIQNLKAYFNCIYENAKEEKILNNSASFYLVSADKETHKYEFISFISTKQRHSPITYTNYILNNIIRFEIKRSENYKTYLDNVVITNSPFHLGYEEKTDKKSRNGFTLVLFISIALALIPSNFITIIIREKENKSKRLQLLSGLSIYTYWINNYIFELIKYYVVVGICFIIVYIFKFYEKYLAIFYLFYGPSLVSFTYVISYFINSEGAGQIIVLLINLIIGALLGSAVLILRTNENMKKLGIVLSYIFRLIPCFCISYGYNQLISRKVLFAIDYFKNYNKDEYESLKKKYNDPSFIIKDAKYITNDIIFLVLEIFIYTGLLIFLEKKDYFLWKLGFSKNRYQKYFIDLDLKPAPKKNVRTKEKDIYDIFNNNDGKNNNDIYPLIVNKLKKSYYDKKNNYFNCCKKKKETVLENITFQVENGECFGLLGGNGAGKTTLFKCLCQEIKPDQGSILIKKQNIYDFNIKEKQIIGYCPQFDSIFEFLTVKENLRFYGHLKRINEYNLDKIINIILKKLDLTKFSDKLTLNLSGGNKRKLSVGISLISKPCIILMDEPSNGMDPYTRKLLLDILFKAYLRNNSNKYEDEKNKKEENSRSIVLTTHLIEEVESLCDNIGIIVKGKFRENGKISEILNKKSKGIELNIEFIKPSPESLKQKYGNVLREKVTDIKQFLGYLGRDEYCKYLKPNHFGKMLLKIKDSKKSVMKLSIIRWIEYLDCLLGLTTKIKEYFDAVECIKFNSNNFILKIYNINSQYKNDSHIFGIMEKFKEKYKIEEYCYNLTTLENIFIDCCNSKELKNLSTEKTEDLEKDKYSEYSKEDRYNGEEKDLNSNNIIL